ncbi:MAG: bacteriohemerythrin [Xanthomonadales bacterium]|nr:hemerythrin family protein [Xanthomonadales bacterium]NIX12073.1 bacteriohemerythrin [Xanthomonadales bacterium]
MILLEWKPEFSLNIPAVDHEHREMIGLINTCYERMGRDADAEAIGRFLGEIHTGIAAHFALEEHLMRRGAYPEYEAHKEDHEELLDCIRDLMDAFDEDREAGLQRLRKQLANWFGNHFSTFDARLHEHFPG